MNKTNSKNSRVEKATNSRNNVPKRTPKDNSRKNITENQKKATPFMTGNEDVIDESRKKGKKCLGKKEGGVTTEMKKTSVPSEKTINIDKNKVEKKPLLVSEKEKLEEQKKAALLITVNKDFIDDNGKIIGGLEKKEDTAGTEIGNKGVLKEKLVIIDKQETGKEATESLEQRETKSVVIPEVPNAAYKKVEQDPIVEPESKKEKRPSFIEIKDKSDVFKKIIDIALAYEKLENEQKELKKRIKLQSDEIAELKEERDSFKRNLEATELLCQKKQLDIDNLRADIEHRNEVIDIVKADKVESSQEFKNALAASLRTFMQDFNELKGLDMNDDVGYAVIETLENVFKTLDKNGICI